jgi:Ca2+-binding RTX toxin-like protein
MATFTGTGADETITPDIVSPTVTADPAGSKPGNGADTIAAGDGNDVVDGGGGNDIVDLGGGDDRVVWTMNGASDTVDGGAGTDTVEFHGLAGGDTIEVYQAGGYVNISNIGPIVTTSNVEAIKLFGYGSQDAIFVRHLAGTSIQDVVVDLGIAPGGAPDGERDDVLLFGSDGGDKIALHHAEDGSVFATGRGPRVSVTGFDKGIDEIRIHGGAGNDRITATEMGKKAPLLSLYGEDGNDKLVGGKRSDNLRGGDGVDILKGGKGDDHLNGEMGKDVLKGGKGADVFLFSSEIVATGRDKIMDFKVGQDMIGILHGITGLGETVEKGHFRQGTKAKDADDHIIYDKSSGVIRWDVDGKGGEAAVAFAKVDKGLKLSHKDFDFILD